MVRELDNEQAKWQKLIESRDFNKLSDSEKYFVLDFGTKSSYEISRKAILEMKSEDDVLPRPLILADEKKGFAVVIPLYQAVIAMAAAFVIGFMLLRSETATKVNEPRIPMAKIDTVYIEHKTTDTVFQVEREYIDRYIVRKEMQQSCNEVAQKKRTNAGIFAGAGPSLPELTSMDLENKGTAASRDNSFALVEGFMREREQD